MPRKKKVIKGYKVFNPDWTCKGFQYKVGGEYKMDDDIEICRKGFHFCLNLNDCFDFYAFNPNNKVAEIEALGKIKNKKGDIKSVTNHIKIIRELDWLEICELVNSGKKNTGRGNSGDWNSGDWNSGDWNSGDWNSGNRNSGYCNSGNCNSGNRNSGNCNSGYCNSGNWNSGYCNSGNWNSGIFNSLNANLFFFNKKTKFNMIEIEKNYSIAINAIKYNEFPLNQWVSENKMTDKEKEENPCYKTTGGFLKTNSYKDAWAWAWKHFTEKEKQAIIELPNFNKKIFFDITGIEV